MNDFPTGLVIPFPTIEAKLGKFRRTLIQPTTFGLLAHLTVIFPFIPKSMLTTAVSQKLASLFQQIDPIPYTIDRLGRFPDVLYLKMVDEQPFIDLIQSVEKAFPDYPPFSGEFPNIVPHITIARNQNIEESEAIFWDQFPAWLPISGVCEHVWLVDKVGEHFQKNIDFLLGDGESNA